MESGIASSRLLDRNTGPSCCPLVLKNRYCFKSADLACCAPALHRLVLWSFGDMEIDVDFFQVLFRMITFSTHAKAGED
jgi:hypothetical protein